MTPSQGSQRAEPEQEHRGNSNAWVRLEHLRVVEFKRACMGEDCASPSCPTAPPWLGVNQAASASPSEPVWLLSGDPLDHRVGTNPGSNHYPESWCQKASDQKEAKHSSPGQQERSCAVAMTWSREGPIHLLLSRGLRGNGVGAVGRRLWLDLGHCFCHHRAKVMTSGRAEPSLCLGVSKAEHRPRAGHFHPSP